MAKGEQAVTEGRKTLLSERAGTQIDHDAATPIYGTAMRGRTQHGLLDRANRVYQGGGELENFVFRKRGLVSFSMDVWDQIKDEADWIEMIDHKKNECYRIDIETAKTHGVVYDAGIGPRWGVPLAKFKIILADGMEKS